ncbi:MAG: hypothetical protein NTV02_00925 [Candidatus Zambryskibacteria bacterium]|nr:hypothetical protein [Candidatus Zambryskibacteria bacterium]
MNIHPFFVHFPIALLTLYGVMEIVWSKVLKRELWWLNSKALLLTCGVLGGFAALQTGEIAEGLRERGSQLIETHSFYATVSVWIFVALLVGYIVFYVEKYTASSEEQSFIKKITTVLKPIGRLIMWGAPVLACVGIITLIITGALGGAIVYGPDTDPIVHFVYNAFVGLQ